MTEAPDAGPVALVTGASGGIGRATVGLLAARGYTVAAVARGRDRLEAMAEAGIRPFACDVSDRAAVAQTVAQVREELGRIDALVNSAGAVFRARLEDATDAQIDALIDTNLVGTINVTRAALPALKERGGAIVNLSSVLAHRPVPAVPIYAATKGGIEAFTRALSIELGPARIRVNVVQPSLVHTEIWETGGRDAADVAAYMERTGRSYPVGRIGEVADVAEMIVFLLSDETEWMTGSIVTVDGGSTIGRVERPADGDADR